MDSKYILVTGANSGIGLELTKNLLKNNYCVFAISRSVSNLEIIKNEYPSTLKIASFDLINFENYEGLFKTICDARKLDGIVHSAGVELTLPISLSNNIKALELFNINLFAPMELLRFFSKKKYSNSNSSVVIISSVMSILGQPGKTIYCSSKSSIIGLVKSSALELAKRKIRVNAVSPGVVETRMTKNLFTQISESKVNEIIDSHPLGIGTVKDVTPIIEFLISEKSKWITGQNFVVDGGYSIV